jgi:hypothetical protein
MSLVIYLFFQKRKIFDASIIWIMLGLYALGSALVTGEGRLGFGVGEAYASRYTTVSQLFLISNIMLCWQSRSVFSKFFKRWHVATISTALAIVFLLVGSNMVWGIHNFHSQKMYRGDIKNCTHMSNPSNICLLSTYPNVTTVTPRLEYLKQIHWGGY